MPDAQFDRLRAIVEAPSPVGLEGAMTHGVLAPMFSSFMPPSWQLRTFQGSASIVVDTLPDAAPEDCFTLMVVGHADKIRMQVRSIGSDGKIYINSDSFLPLTLLGNDVTLFSEDPAQPGEGRYRRVEGGTVEALGAIHFAPANVRSGAKGVKADQLYLELGFHGSPAERKAQATALGIRPGDPLLLRRPLRRGFAPDTVVSPYLDVRYVGRPNCETALHCTARTAAPRRSYPCSYPCSYVDSSSHWCTALWCTAPAP